MPNVSASLSNSESSSASQQTAFNQNFTRMFGDKNLGRGTDLAKPAIIAGAAIIVYMILKKKKVI